MKPVSERKIIVLKRDCAATLVPSGSRVFLHQDTEVTLTQSLGNSFTVNVFGNLVRIEGKDADALGMELDDPLRHLSDEATILEKVWALLKTVFDPEIPVNIVDLGLVYDCSVIALNETENRVEVKMTLTAPGCGMGPVIAEDAKQKILSLPDVTEAVVEVVFDPPWDRSMMSDVAQLELGMF
jgi:probable FeS assembly SUF system protein SufT